MTTHSEKDLHPYKRKAEELFNICTRKPPVQLIDTENREWCLNRIEDALDAARAEGRKSTYDEIIASLNGLRMHGNIPRGMITVSSAIETVKILKEDAFPSPPDAATSVFGDIVSKRNPGMGD